MKCKECRFYSGGAICRRYPPTIVNEGGGMHPDYRERWPEMLEDDWCGEFQKRDRG